MVIIIDLYPCKESIALRVQKLKMRSICVQEAKGQGD